MATSTGRRLRAFIKRPVVRSVLITAAFGVVLVSFFPMENLSYDVATFLKPQDGKSITNAALVYVDHSTEDTLSPNEQKLDRMDYARLLNRLTDAGVKWVFMDVFFRSNSTPEADAALVQAMRRNKGVVLAAEFAEDTHRTDANVYVLKSPAPDFADAAAGRVGHGKMLERVVRKIPGDYKFMSSAAWITAINVRTNLAAEDPKTEHWLNYYGPPPSEIIPKCPLENVLSSNIPPGFLNKEIVFVGQDSPGENAGNVRGMKDHFETPYSTFGSAPMAGVRIHATAVLNLIRGESLTRIPLPWQWLGAGCWAVIITGSLYFISRRSRIIMYFVAFAAAMALCAISLNLQWHVHWFWAWMGPALGQTPLALALVLRAPRLDPYLAFISYRTKEDGSTALLIQRSLAERGFKAFIDKQSLHAGKFNEQLLREIEVSTFFIPILSRNSLTRCAEEGDWVLRELTHALAQRKTIVPVMKDDFSFDAPNIPRLPEIAELRNFHGLDYTDADFDGFMEKLRKLLRAS